MHVSTSDWIAFGMAVLGFLGTIIGRYWPALPAKANEALKRLGGLDAVIAFIDQAYAAAQTNEARRAFVLAKLKALVPDVPDSILNLLIEWAFQRVKWH